MRKFLRKYGFWLFVIILALIATTQVQAATPTPTATATAAAPEPNEVNIQELLELLKEMLLLLKQQQLPTTTAPNPVSANPASSMCRDGEVIGNERNPLDRTPVGLAENNVAIEVSWQPGSGFGGFDRVVFVLPKLEGYQVFLNGVATIHMTRYCGSLQEVETYLANPKTHVAAMRATAADSQGNMPAEAEIGVYSLNLQTSNLHVLKAAPAGPSLQEVKNHIEVVRLASTSVPTTTPATPVSAAAASCPPATQYTIGWDVTNPKDVTIIGPAIANLGFPTEGEAQYRAYVPAGTTVIFLKVGGAYWQFDESSCTDSGLRAQWQDGSLPAWTVEQFHQAGHVN